MDDLFFVASKLGGALLRLDSILILLLLVGVLALVAGRARLALAALSPALAGALLVVIVPLGDPLLRHLEARYPPEPPLDGVVGIVVLGGAEDLGPTLAWGAPQVNGAADRLIAAAALAQRLPDAPVLVTGGRSRLRPGPSGEGSVAAEVLLALGVPAARLLVEDRSRSTAENAAFSLALAKGVGPGRWVLVTSAFHMPRAVATFCAAGWTGLVPWPTDYRSAGGGIDWDLTGHLDQLNLALKERAGNLAYRLTGRAGPEAC